MTDLQYYKAGVDDIEAMVKGRIAFQSEYWGEQPREAVEELSRELRQYYTTAVPEGRCICWLAKAEGEIVGIGIMAIRQQPGNFKNPSGKSGYLMNMHTLPGYRRLGIATTLLERLQESAHEMGITAFELHATRDGAPVYERNGFLLHGEPTYRKYES